MGQRIDGKYKSSYENAKAILAHNRENLLETDPLGVANIFAVLANYEATILLAEEVRHTRSGIDLLARNNPAAGQLSVLNERIQDLTDMLESYRGEVPVQLESFQSFIDEYIEAYVTRMNEGPAEDV